jgi:hypothetical protein
MALEYFLPVYAAKMAGNLMHLYLGLLLLLSATAQEVKSLLAS